MIKIEYIGVRRKPLIRLFPKNRYFMLDKKSDTYFCLYGSTDLNGSNYGRELAVVNAYSVKTHMLLSTTPMRYDTLVYPIELVHFETENLDKYVY